MFALDDAFLEFHTWNSTFTLTLQVAVNLLGERVRDVPLPPKYAAQCYWTPLALRRLVGETLSRIEESTRRGSRKRPRIRNILGHCSITCP